MTQNQFKARITEIKTLSPEVKSFTFEAEECTPFSNASAGGHIDIHTSAGLIRQYSMWNWNNVGSQASVAVKYEIGGRGGSIWMHDELHVGSQVTLSGPRNHFSLQQSQNTILLAGGIGATPIFAMADELTRRGESFSVWYLNRSRATASFLSSFESLGLGEDLHCYFDDEDGPVDMDIIFANSNSDTRFYVCGPEGMLEAALRTAKCRLPEENIHFERFSNTPEENPDGDITFEIKLARTGGILTVSKEDSVLNVLEEYGVDVYFGCSEGICGACKIDVLEGEIDHRDAVLSPGEQASNNVMCVCVSRAKSQRLVLDI